MTVDLGIKLTLRTSGTGRYTYSEVGLVDKNNVLYLSILFVTDSIQQNLLLNVCPCSHFCKPVTIAWAGGSYSNAVDVWHL